MFFIGRIIRASKGLDQGFRDCSWGENEEDPKWFYQSKQVISFTRCIQKIKFNVGYKFKARQGNWWLFLKSTISLLRYIFYLFCCKSKGLPKLQFYLDRENIYWYFPYSILTIDDCQSLSYYFGFQDSKNMLYMG